MIVELKADWNNNQSQNIAFSQVIDHAFFIVGILFSAENAQWEVETINIIKINGKQYSFFLIKIKFLRFSLNSMRNNFKQSIDSIDYILIHQNYLSHQVQKSTNGNSVFEFW